MNERRLTIWMNVASFYQLAFFRELLKNDVDLRVVFAKPLPPERRNLGWLDDVAGLASQILRRWLGGIDGLWIVVRDWSRIHIVNGIWGEKAFFPALLVLALLRRPFFVYTEAPQPRTRRKWVTLLLFGLIGPFIARRARGFFVVGKAGADFARSLGAADAKIYRFGYFCKSPDVGSSHPSQPGRRIIYVGQFVERKGLDVLLKAVSNLKDSDVRVTLIGTGVAADDLRHQAADLGVGAQVEFLPPMDNDAVVKRMTSADVLVLPSRWDGWGLVVNEALMAGLPVVLSERCGAAELIEEGVNGYVFPSEDDVALSDRIRAVFASLPTLRQGASRTSASIELPVVTRYFRSCVTHAMSGAGAQPQPPWRRR